MYPPSHCKMDWQSTHIKLGEAQVDAAVRIKDLSRNLSALLCLLARLPKYHSKLSAAGWPMDKFDVRSAHTLHATNQFRGYDARPCESKTV